MRLTGQAVRARRFPAPANCLARLRTLWRDDSAVSVIELSFTLPVFLSLGMFGLELVNLATVNMQVSQIALSLADNASRLGQTDNSAVAPTVNETDVDSVMTGAVEEGKVIDLAANGRVILTSLEVDDESGKQYIHWQRCRGTLDRDSAYGDEDANNGLSGPAITGIGRGATKITAQANSAVMFVEVFYTYEPIFGDLFVGQKSISHEAAYTIRDDRDLDSGVSGTRSADDPCV
jgi:hypothetical protein